MSEGLRKQLTYVKTTNKSVIGSSYEKYDVAQLAEYLLSTYEALGSLSTCNLHINQAWWYTAPIPALETWWRWRDDLRNSRSSLATK